MTVQEYIISECRKESLTEEAIAALLAQIQAESAFKVNNLEDTANTKLGMTDEQYTAAVDNGTYTNFVLDGYGYGIYQLTFYTRKQNFLNYVRARNGSIGDLKLQVGFMFWEFKSYFAGLWSQMKSSRDLYALTKDLLEKWENPYEQVQNLISRYEYAKSWYSKLKDYKEVGKSMTTNEAIERVLSIAKNEIGYHEQGDNVTKYAAYLDSISGFYNGPKQNAPWCDVFYDYLFVKCFGLEIGRQMICQPMNSAGAGCLYSAQYYKEAGRWFATPQPGDQIFFSYAAGEYSHTGIVESVYNGMVHTIEGNTSDSVARRSYALSSGSIVGYGRPRWDLAADSSADSSADISIDIPAQTQTGGSGTMILRRGSKGINVREYQEKLIELGYDLGRWGADGDFGTDTYNAVVKFQREHGLDIDGEIGPLTAAAIEEALGGETVTQTDDDEIENSTPVNPVTERPYSVNQANEQGQKEANVSQPSAAVQETAVAGGSPFKFNVGDTVNFVGNGHYFSAIAKVGFACKPGRAVVRAINRASNAKHPYRVSAVRGGGSTVNGWVDADALQAVQ